MPSPKGKKVPGKGGAPNALWGKEKLPSRINSQGPKKGLGKERNIYVPLKAEDDGERIYSKNGNRLFSKRSKGKEGLGKKILLVQRGIL